MGEVEARLLEVDDGIRAALVTLRLLEADPLPPKDLSAREVESVEQEYGCVLPDPILAAFAANTDELGEQAEMDLPDVVAHTQEAYGRGCPRDLIAVGRQPDGLAYYCIERRADWDGHPVVLRIFDSQDHSISVHPLAAWLDERVEACRESLQEGDADDRARAELEPTDTQLARFRPRVRSIAAGEAATSDPGPRTVRHAKFGPGTVLRETGSGMDRKLEVDFEQVGTKVILARFLDES